MVGRGTIRNPAITTAQLANLLAPTSGRPVQDRTSLTGTLSVDLQWAQDQGTDTNTALPTSIFSAVDEQLGFKLEAIRGVMDVLVIDHVEHPTAD
jgi:uncharacterized protein (TIGR03435 family)